MSEYDIKVTREDGKYIVDLGEKGNAALLERYEAFVKEVNAKRNDLSPDEKAIVLGDEESQNCRLLKDWMGQLMELINVQKKLEENNGEVLDGKPPQPLEGECEVFVSKATDEQIASVL